jgi:peptidoglycan/xylan/chitin deacetylase (PgdA/CDA1 family)
MKRPGRLADMADKPLPVIMYHSVGVVDTGWGWNHLTCPFATFESQLKWLKKKSFRTLTMTQVLEHFRKGPAEKDRAVALTFDDGYLDNWSFVYPLLKKYGLTATFFVSPEFIDPGEEVRPTLEDVWKGRLSPAELSSQGYMSWKELAAMTAEGVADVQSHALTHTWYPRTDRIIDFRHPADSYIWMTWNRHPGEKPYLQKDRGELVDWGAPVYEHGKALETRRFFPDPGLSRFLVEYVRSRGGETFFEGEWRETLFARSAEYKAQHALQERYETEEEHEARIRLELRSSKELIQQRLKKPVNFLCWPGGGVSPAALRIAEEEGYLGSTYTSREARIRPLPGKPAGGHIRLERIGASLHGSSAKAPRSRAVYLSGPLFILSLYLFQGKQPRAFFSRLVLGTSKRLSMIRNSL